MLDISELQKERLELEGLIKKYYGEWKSVCLLIKQQKGKIDSKDPLAVKLGRSGGLRGGLARAANMTPDERHKAASRAAKVRWERLKKEGLAK